MARVAVRLRRAVTSSPSHATGWPSKASTTTSYSPDAIRSTASKNDGSMSILYSPKRPSSLARSRWRGRPTSMTDGASPAVGQGTRYPNRRIKRTTSTRRKRRCPPTVRHPSIWPLFTQLWMVLRSTSRRRATSPVVSVVREICPVSTAMNRICQTQVAARITPRGDVEPIF